MLRELSIAEVNLVGGAAEVSPTPMPTGPSDSTFGQNVCKFSETLFGINSYVSDISCGVDWTGDNPRDSINQSPERLEQIAEEHNGAK